MVITADINCFVFSLWSLKCDFASAIKHRQQQFCGCFKKKWQQLFKCNTDNTNRTKTSVNSMWHIKILNGIDITLDFNLFLLFWVFVLLSKNTHTHADIHTWTRANSNDHIAHFEHSICMVGACPWLLKRFFTGTHHTFSDNLVTMITHFVHLTMTSRAFIAFRLKNRSQFSTSTIIWQFKLA